MTSTNEPSFIDRAVARSFDKPLPGAAQYAVAALVIVLMALARVLFLPASLPWLLFIPATIAITLTLARGPGYLAAGLSAALGMASILGPSRLGDLSQLQWTAGGLFLIVDVGLVALAGALRTSLAKARTLNASLVEGRQQALEREAFVSSVLASSTDCIKVLDLDGRLTFMSEGGQRVMEVSDFNAVAGCPWPDFWHGVGNAEAVASIEAARQGRATRFIGKADTFAGTSRWWHVAVSPINGSDGKPDRILSVSRDITDLRTSEEDRDRFVRLAENSTDFVGMANTDGHVSYLNDAARRLVGLGVDDVTALTISDFFPPDQDKIVQREVLPAVAAGGDWSGELSFRHFETGELIPVLYSVFPLTDADGALLGYGTVTRDYRAKKVAEEQLRLLNGELSHRLKNTLSIVQAIALQTLGSADPAMLSAFSKRLNALSAAHDVLVKDSWSTASIDDVARAALCSFDESDRFNIAGPDLTIGPRATLALSLLLHELATNATKYGALSVPLGVVSVAWSVEGEGKDATMLLRWIERGGPPAVEPTRRGFGSRLIRMGLTGSGGVDLRYGEEGFTAEMSAPLQQMQQA